MVGEENNDTDDSWGTAIHATKFALWSSVAHRLSEIGSMRAGSRQYQDAAQWMRRRANELAKTEMAKQGMGSEHVGWVLTLYDVPSKDQLPRSIAASWLGRMFLERPTIGGAPPSVEYVGPNLP